ncbi:MAG TPA: inositol monophosphatase family protein [Candidatus Bathyarchaeia archaeon]|nr:inositol monophosphatase family protein [Candidatus Bathyarchaeia archaeon]
MTVPFRREALVAILDDAAAIVRRARLSPEAVRLKGDGSPVTDLDRDVDLFLRDELTKLAPESGWLSEESPDDGSRRTAPYAWIVDPIDGTKELIAGRDEIAISVALVRLGAVVAAAVVNPLRAERGVWLEGEDAIFEGLTRRPPATSLAQASVIVSRTESEGGDLRGLEGIFGAVREVGSVAYKLLRVAAGADDLTYSVRPKREWDVCGGVGLVRAAGGEVVRLDEVPLAFNRADTRIPGGHVAGPKPLVSVAKDALHARLSRR